MLDKKTQEEIKKIVFHFLDPKECQAFIFGSRAEDTARKFSDVDIGIVSKRKINDLLLSEIKEVFEESDLPYKVEIVDFSTVSKKFKQVANKKIIPLN